MADETPEKKQDGAVAEAAAAAAAAKGPNPWIPIIVMVVVMPVISLVMTQYVLIPRIKSSVSGEGGKPAASSSADSKQGEEGKDGKGDSKQTFSYEFKDVVVNLSGAMGTRYLKTSFSVVSSHPDLQKIVTDNKSHLLDVALSVLSSKSMADLESPGSKNLVRNDLMASFNQALNNEVVEQIYFSEFVVQ